MKSKADDGWVTACAFQLEYRLSAAEQCQHGGSGVRTALCPAVGVRLQHQPLEDLRRL